MKRILLLGAGGPAGVNFARCLELEKDIEIYGVDTNRYNLNLAKLHCKQVFGRPYSRNFAGHIDYYNEIIEEYDIDFVHAQPDPEVHLISLHRKYLKAKTFLPDHNIIDICQDKLLTADLWDEPFDGLTHPILIERTDSLFTKLMEIYNRFGSPYWLRATQGAGGKASLYVNKIEYAYHWLKFWFSYDKDIVFMAQPYLTEPNIAWQSLWKDGELIVSQGRNRLEALYGRMAVSGISGSSSVSKLNNHFRANKAGIKAVKTIDPKPHGVYSVDLMGHLGNIVPTEINAGRFFTMSYLLGKASIETNTPRGNIPLMYIKLAFGEDIPLGLPLNVLPSDLYWIRHVDCGTHLIKKEDLI